MKQNCYIFLNTKTEQPIQNYENNEDTILIINPIIFSGMKSCHYENVFCDKNFCMSNSGQLLIEEVFKSIAFNSFSFI